MPLPVIINTKTIAFLPDLPLELVILAYQLIELTHCSVALRGETVLNHLFRQPLNFDLLEFRVTNIIGAIAMNTLKGIALYSKGRFDLNGLTFMISFVEQDGLIFTLDGKDQSGCPIIIKVYEYNIGYDYDINNIEINFSREVPSGVIKMSDKHLEALTLFGKRAPQISHCLRKSFKVDSATLLNHTNLIKVVFNTLKLVERRIEVKDVSHLSTPCPKCHKLFNPDINSDSTTTNSMTSVQINGNKYLSALNALGYQFKCGHKYCLECFVKMVKVQNGVTKCQFCQENLTHNPISEHLEIDYESIKSLFLYYEDPEEKVNYDDEHHTDYQNFKEALE